MLKQENWKFYLSQGNNLYLNRMTFQVTSEAYVWHTMDVLSLYPQRACVSLTWSFDKKQNVIKKILLLTRKVTQDVFKN